MQGVIQNFFLGGAKCAREARSNLSWGVWGGAVSLPPRPPAGRGHGPGGGSGGEAPEKL